MFPSHTHKGPSVDWRCVPFTVGWGIGSVCRLALCSLHSGVGHWGCEQTGDVSLVVWWWGGDLAREVTGSVCPWESGGWMGNWGWELAGSFCPRESGGRVGKGIYGTFKDKTFGPMS